MLFYIIKWTILYLILIWLIHNLFLFFQKHLTTTKTKDYYTTINAEYNKINSIIKSNNDIHKTTEELYYDISNNDIPITYGSINDIPINDIPINDIPINDIPINDIPINDNMKYVLNDFLNTLDKP